ncbi:hypothetical protein [Parasitella parasitica]|uniref:Uncharacterized protein n=1 Tax=Parasitella parasitica TaxID=35722 RepID=A0A0B7N6B1_9FUNG|nr:hypothetical protein [Parasitella parasitica]
MWNKPAAGASCEPPIGTKVDFFRPSLRYGDFFHRSSGGGDSSWKAARNNGNTKLYHDLGKLLREGKDVLDCLLLTTSDTAEVSKSGSWMIQISCLQAESSSIHLAGDDLYVGAPQGKILFPSSLSSLDEFIRLLKRIFSFVSKMEKSATFLKKKIDLTKNRRESICTTFDRQESFKSEDNDVQSGERPTWYTPTRGDYFHSKIPQELYGVEPVHELLWTLPTNENEPVFDPTQVDEYGWVCVSEGKWHDTFSESWAKERPY